MALQLAGAGGAPAATPAACRDRRGTRVVHPPAALPACAGRPWLPHWQPAGPQAAALCRSSLLDCARAPAGQAGLRRPCCSERSQVRTHAHLHQRLPAPPVQEQLGAMQLHASALQRACCSSLAEACAVAHGARRRRRRAAPNNKQQWSKRWNRQKTWNRAHCCCSPSATCVLRHAAPSLLAQAGCQAEAYGVTQCQEDCCKPVSIQWYQPLRLLWLVALEFEVTDRVSVLRPRQCCTSVPRPPAFLLYSCSR